MKLSLVTVFVLLAGIAALAQTSRLSFPANGFSVDVLEEANPSAEQASAPLVMTLPPSGGFAPNVNVSIQPYTGNLEDYVTLSEGQFKTGNYKVLNTKKLDSKMWQWEYTGMVKSLALHFYSKVIVNGKKAFLSTATATETQWKVHAERLKNVVNSFKLD